MNQVKGFGFFIAIASPTAFARKARAAIWAV